MPPRKHLAKFEPVTPTPGPSASSLSQPPPPSLPALTKQHLASLQLPGTQCPEPSIQSAREQVSPYGSCPPSRSLSPSSGASTPSLGLEGLDLPELPAVNIPVDLAAMIRQAFDRAYQAINPIAAAIKDDPDLVITFSNSLRCFATTLGADFPHP